MRSRRHRTNAYTGAAVGLLVAVTAVVHGAQGGGPYQRQRIDAAAAERGRALYAPATGIRAAGSTTVRSGVLSTAGNLLFAGDSSANFVAFDATSGTPLWHAGLHTSITNGPMTYELDGTQFVVAGAGDSLYAFALRNR
jgi:outer membrane protein assembly factor BamB